MGDLTALRERVAGLTGPDREVDAELHIWEAPYLWRQDPDGNWEHNRHGTALNPVWVPASPLEVAPRLTASIDAALVLVERVLPGWKLMLDIRVIEIPPVRARLFGPGLVAAPMDYEGADYGQARAPTAPIAIILALLDALIAENKE